MNTLSTDFFNKLPKADLHCHLDGSLRLETMIELAKENSVLLPSYNSVELKNVLGFGAIQHNLERYIATFDYMCAVMKTPRAIERVTFELVEDAARENVLHLEIRFCPTLLESDDLSVEQVVEASLRGMQKAMQQFDVSAVLILCGLKHYTPAKNLAIAQVAAKYKDAGVAAFDLAGPEAGYPSKNHKESCYFAVSNYLNLTIHAGEAFGPQSIAQALFDCGAHRIGHGVRLGEDEDLLRFVVDRQIPLELCVSSNLHTQVMSDIAHHPIRKLFDAGVKVTVNTDNRLMSDTTLSKEYEILHSDLGFDADEIKRISLNGFENAFLPYEKKNALVEKVQKVMSYL